MKNTLPTPANSLRMLRLGDIWHYRVAGTLTPPNSPPLELSGEITVSITADQLLSRDDAMSIVFAQHFEVTQLDGSQRTMPAPEWKFSFVQDAIGKDLSIIADNMTPDGASRSAKVPQVFYPGTWSSQTSYSNRLEFDNGDSVENTLAVLGEENAETEKGTFHSWLAKISSRSAATGLIEGMDWWTPELGAPAKFSTASTMPDGSQMRFVATLVDSNVF